MRTCVLLAGCNTRTDAPLWWSLLLMAAWTPEVLLARSSAVPFLPMTEGSVVSLFSSKHRCSGPNVIALGVPVGTRLFWCGRALCGSSRDLSGRSRGWGRRGWLGRASPMYNRIYKIYQHPMRAICEMHVLPIYIQMERRFKGFTYLGRM